MRARAVVAIVCCVALSGCKEKPSTAPSPSPSPAPPSTPAAAPSPAAAPGATPTPAAHAAPAGACPASDLKEDDGFAVVGKERIGPLKIGLTDTEVKAALGPPEKMSKPESSEAEGGFAREWTYEKRGLVLGMSADKKSGPWRLGAITVTAPAPEKTRFGIGIGSTREDVVRAYGACFEERPAADAPALVAGSSYGGVLFELEKGAVKSIFVGAMAE